MKMHMGGRNDYPEPVQRAIERHLRGIEWLDTIEPAVLELQAISNEIDTGRCSIRVEDRFISFSLVASTLSDATPVRRALAKAGYRLNGQPIDVAEADLRIYRYVKLFGDAEVVVHLAVSFVGQACRYVEVGRTSVPEYKLVCEGRVE